ncbi:hypothetical protein Ga0074812_1497 [Parafrankia irregularis]|uniref:DUF8175 domain-containing protein n=1 Tax=Parafrankia irregularis TaxID=795642 RepID=A0A0S4R0E0_9ACTN|nr:MULTISPECIES: hypothetical protein [Frankiaceae]KPM50550.1 hypothetical protein ACG83_38970 [Frankia sp. R43]MBE3204732.1 hypothetical protein [Parafrankia sp. CH37]CUU60863.1 hypothetical protein Ga0074812_1497 [Parafrankia irregularis]
MRRPPHTADRRHPGLTVAPRPCVAALLLLAVLAACTAPTRAGQEQPRTPTSTPALSDDPEAALPVLPPGNTITDNGVPLGFPHSTSGAVSAAVRWTSLLLPRTEADQAEILTTIATPSYLLQRTAGTLLDHVYAPPDLAPGSALFFRPLGTHLLATDPDQPVIAVLHASRVSGTRRPTVLVGSVTWELVWDGDDWRLADLHPTLPSAGLRVPETDSPAAVTAAGWDRFRRA